MSLRSAAKRIGRFLFWVGIVLTAVNIENLAERFGLDRVLANAVQGRGFDAKVVRALRSSETLYLALILLGIGIAAQVDYLAKKIDTWRGPKPWWTGLHSFTIQGFSCLVAGIPEDGFENSARARAVASEIVGYVNSGHMPLMLEPTNPGNVRHGDYDGPPYVPKKVDFDAVVLKGDLERLAIARGWKLPWEPNPRPRRPGVPIPKKLNALLSPVNTEPETQR